MDESYAQLPLFATGKRCKTCVRMLPLDAFYVTRRRYKDKVYEYLSGDCRECANAKTLANYIANREQRLAQRAEYRRNNREKVLAAKRRYNATVPKEKHAAESKRWVALHKEEHAAQVREWRINNPDKNREKAQAYRARRVGAFIAPIDHLAIWERDNRSCRICGKGVAFKDMHLDHIIPLSKGGTHEPANAQATCAFCNLSKGAKLPT